MNDNSLKTIEFNEFKNNILLHIYRYFRYNNRSNIKVKFIKFEEYYKDDKRLALKFRMFHRCINNSNFYVGSSHITCDKNMIFLLNYSTVTVSFKNVLLRRKFSSSFEEGLSTWYV